MGLPSFQSVSTFAPKKYCLAVAGFTRASHTSELDALMTTEALETCSRSILGFAPLLTHNGLAFSCRERATRSVPKTNDLGREAVSCNAGLGAHSGSVEGTWSDSSLPSDPVYVRFVSTICVAF